MEHTQDFEVDLSNPIEDQIIPMRRTPNIAGGMAWQDWIPLGLRHQLCAKLLKRGHKAQRFSPAIASNVVADLLKVPARRRRERKLHSGLPLSSL